MKTGRQTGVKVVREQKNVKNIAVIFAEGKENT